MLVDATEDKPDRDVTDGEGGLITHRAGAVALEADGGQNLQLGELGERLGGEAGRNVTEVGELVGRVGLFATLETFGHNRADEQGEEVAVATADVPHVGLEAEEADVLRGVNQLGAEEADHPRKLQPKHEQRQGGKAAVDGVVLADPDLTVDIEVLEDLKGTAHEGAGHEGVEEAHTRVGRQEVKQGEEEDDDGVGHEAQCGVSDRRKEDVGAEQGAAQGGKEDGETTGDGHQYGQDDDHGRIGRHFAVPGAVFFHLPDAVEGVLHGGDEAKDGVEQQHEADAEENAAASQGEVVLSKVEPARDLGRLGGEGVVEALFDHVLHAESAGDAHHYGQHGHDREEGAIGQCRGARLEVVALIATDGQDERLGDVDIDAARTADIAVGDAPDVVRDEADGVRHPSDGTIHNQGLLLFFLFGHRWDEGEGYGTAVRAN